MVSVKLASHSRWSVFINYRRTAPSNLFGVMNATWRGRTRVGAASWRRSGRPCRRLIRQELAVGSARARVPVDDLVDLEGVRLAGVEPGQRLADVVVQSASGAS